MRRGQPRKLHESVELQRPLAGRWEAVHGVPATQHQRSQPFGVKFRDADSEPCSHRVSDQMGTLAIELIDHRNDVSGPWLLMVASGIGWLVAPLVAERVH